MGRVELKWAYKETSKATALFFDGKPTDAYRADNRGEVETRHDMFAYMAVCEAALHAIGTHKKPEYLQKHGLGVTTGDACGMSGAVAIANHALTFNTGQTTEELLRKCYDDMDPEKEAERKAEIKKHLGL